MTNDGHAAFAATGEAAQRLAGVIAARHRGDESGVGPLLDGLDNATRAAGGLLLADVAIGLLAHAEGREPADVAAQLSLSIAAYSSELG
jgi:hypothetical protein